MSQCLPRPPSAGCAANNRPESKCHLQSLALGALEQFESELEMLAATAHAAARLKASGIARVIHNADAGLLDRNIQSSKMVHAALLHLMLEAANARPRFTAMPSGCLVSENRQCSSVQFCGALSDCPCQCPLSCTLAEGG